MTSKVLTKAYIEAGLASFKEYVASVMAGSSGGGSSGAAGSSSATVVRATPLEHDVVLSIARARMPPERSLTPMWQILSDAVKAAVVQELRDGYAFEEKAGKVVTLHELIGMLPLTFLLNLGSDKEVDIAKKSKANRKFYATLEKNLLSVVLAAFPACQILENDTRKDIGGTRFKGPYIDGLYLSLE